MSGTLPSAATIALVNECSVHMDNPVYCGCFSWMAEDLATVEKFRDHVPVRRGIRKKSRKSVVVESDHDDEVCVVPERKDEGLGQVARSSNGTGGRETMNTENPLPQGGTTVVDEVEGMTPDQETYLSDLKARHKGDLSVWQAARLVEFEDGTISKTNASRLISDFRARETKARQEAQKGEESSAAQCTLLNLIANHATANGQGRFGESLRAKVEAAIVGDLDRAQVSSIIDRAKAHLGLTTKEDISALYAGANVAVPADTSHGDQEEPF